MCVLDLILLCNTNKSAFIDILWTLSRKNLVYIQLYVKIMSPGVDLGEMFLFYVILFYWDLKYFIVGLPAKMEA